MTAPRRESPPLLYFCREQRRSGRDVFNFRAALPGPAMRCTRLWTQALLVLAASMLLLSHPHWLQALGRRRAAGLARELARPFADEYLIPNWQRDWIISSSTVQDFAAEALDEATMKSDPRNRVISAQLRAGGPRGT